MENPLTSKINKWDTHLCEHVSCSVFSSGSTSTQQSGVRMASLRKNDRWTYRWSILVVAPWWPPFITSVVTPSSIIGAFTKNSWTFFSPLMLIFTPCFMPCVSKFFRMLLMASFRLDHLAIFGIRCWFAEGRVDPRTIMKVVSRIFNVTLSLLSLSNWLINLSDFHHFKL